MGERRERGNLFEPRVGQLNYRLVDTFSVLLFSNPISPSKLPRNQLEGMTFADSDRRIVWMKKSENGDQDLLRYWIPRYWKLSSVDFSIHRNPVICFFVQIKVMQKQLQLLNSAVNAYFSGDSQALETTLKTFCVKNTKLLPLKSSVTWLEHWVSDAFI